MIDEISSWVQEFRTMRAETSVDVQDALNVKQRSRTSVLPWRGQFSPQLVEFLLKRHPGRRILDPFCGSGTVLYEAGTAGRSAVGVDVNPAAVTLASFAEYCMLPLPDRIEFIERAKRKIRREIAREHGRQIQLDFCSRFPKDAFYTCFLLTLFGDRTEATPAQANAALEQLETKLLALPAVKVPLSAQRGDARFTAFADRSYDLVITSPPYINVFNYHQNYRPVMESLGAAPLAVAKAEIGANRKHRQNRFLTVIQYCMDMQTVFDELWRILAPGGTAVFVVGRSSNVRGVPFLNGEMIASVAVLGGTFSLRHRNERMFVNRFGEKIYEDVLILDRAARRRARESARELGRFVGACALQEARERCTDKIARQEIDDAYKKRDSIERSPRVS